MALPRKARLRPDLWAAPDFLGGDGTQGKTIVGLCILVAKAAGGFLGLRNPISSEEKDAIERIAERLGPNAMAEFQRRLG